MLQTRIVTDDGIKHEIPDQYGKFVVFQYAKKSNDVNREEFITDRQKEIPEDDIISFVNCTSEQHLSQFS